MSLRSVVPSLTFLCLSLALLLAVSNARAGSYVGAYTVAVPGSNPVTYTQTPYSGGIYLLPDLNGTPTPYPYTTGTTQNLASGYGGDSGGTTASCTGAITASWNWVPDPKLANDSPPTNVVVKESCSVKVTVVSPEATGYYNTGGGEQGSVNWSPSGNNTTTATHVQYIVIVGGQTITMSPVDASASASARGDGASVHYTASFVNGNWDGPYYFHSGTNYGGANQGPWANNTAGATPAITDIADSVHSFSWAVTTENNCIVDGTITPVWYWDGPDLGVAPPGFQMNIDLSAVANNPNAITGEELDAYTGKGGSLQNSGTAARSNNSGDYVATVASDEYAPGEGNGFWAIGPSLMLFAHTGAIAENGPFNLSTSVSLTAAINRGF